MNNKFIYIVIAVIAATLISVLIFILNFTDISLLTIVNVFSSMAGIVAGVAALKSLKQIHSLQKKILNTSLERYVKEIYDLADRLSERNLRLLSNFVLPVLEFIGLDSNEKNEDKKDNINAKQKTIVDLFLLNEKKKLLQGKVIALILFVFAVGFNFYTGFSLWFSLPGMLLFVIYELKDQLVTYRVKKGFFGRDSDEACQLLKFIHENIDDLNDDGNGGSRKIWNDKERELKEYINGWIGKQNA
ncbi:hypothetical protein I5418_21515 [Citrobacter braakii]|uniref:hypothetical protein n=1 Tax=Citrobacter braakii TaxID=57706 RepID=UPI0019055A1D|nr:hypothetical protein [Citrobacter braakii]MBJ8899672.1 hypothetical protein [Citrobacter braakii]